MARWTRKFLWLGLAGTTAAVVADRYYDDPKAIWNLPPVALRQIVNAPQIMVTKTDRGAEAYCRCPVVLKPHEIPDIVKKAFIAVEDKRFLDREGGFDLHALGSAAKQGFRRGASTIPMQTFKNLALNDVISTNKYLRKLLELRHSGKFYGAFSKDELLTIYLNQIHFGGLEAGGRDVVGLYRAARHHLAKEPKDINLYEAALLAGVVKAPSNYNPSGDADERAAAHERAQKVLQLMEEQHLISRADRIRALRSGIQRGSMPDFEIEARAFTDWVMKTHGDSVGRSGTVRFFVTLDPYAQRMADNHLAALSETRRIPDSYEAGIVMMSPDGQVRALIGALDWSESQFNRAVSARVQPGSTAKLALLVAAIEAGRNSASPVLDWPLTKDWPSNGGRNYVGWTTLADTIVQSRNAASVRLTQDIGVTRVAETARRLGWDVGPRPDAGFVLGSFSTNAMQMTATYAAVANGGYQVTPTGVLAAVEGLGHVRELPAPPLHRQIIQTRFIKPIQSILASVVENGTGQSAQIDDVEVYGKTGTSSGSTDAWFVGWSKGYVTGVWLGRPRADQGAKGLSGGSAPAVFFSRFVGDLIRRDERRHRSYLASRRRHTVRIRLRGGSPPPAGIGARAPNTQ